MLDFLLNLISYMGDGLLKALRHALKTKPVKNGKKGSIALKRFNSIMDAHCSIDDIIEENGLDEPGCRYPSPEGYRNCYEQARDEIEDEGIIGALAFYEIQMRAYEIAEELVDCWLNGEIWIPEEVLDWAWYEVSDHNG